MNSLDIKRIESKFAKITDAINALKVEKMGMAPDNPQRHVLQEAITILNFRRVDYIDGLRQYYHHGLKDES